MNRRMWAVYYIASNWRVRQRLPRITALARAWGVL